MEALFLVLVKRDQLEALVVLSAIFYTAGPVAAAEPSRGSIIASHWTPPLR